MINHAGHWCKTGSNLQKDIELTFESKVQKSVLKNYANGFVYKKF